SASANTFAMNLATIAQHVASKNKFLAHEDVYVGFLSTTKYLDAATYLNTGATLAADKFLNAMTYQIADAARDTFVSHSAPTFQDTIGNVSANHAAHRHHAAHNNAALQLHAAHNC